MKMLTRSDIRRLRKRLNLSQRDFGGILGVPQMTVYRWEKGISKPNKNHARRLIELRTSSGHSDPQGRERQEQRDLSSNVTADVAVTSSHGESVEPDQSSVRASRQRADRTQGTLGYPSDETNGVSDCGEYTDPTVTRGVQLHSM